MLREVGFASPVVMYVCMHVAQHVRDGHTVVLGACGGRPVVTGSRKVDSLLHILFFRFLGYLSSGATRHILIQYYRIFITHL